MNEAQKSITIKDMIIGVGTRMYNHGDMANIEHTGTVTNVIIDDKWGTQIEITPDDDDIKSYCIPLSMISKFYAGNASTRIVTVDAYNNYRRNGVS